MILLGEALKTRYHVYYLKTNWLSEALPLEVSR